MFTIKLVTPSPLQSAGEWIPDTYEYYSCKRFKTESNGKGLFLNMDTGSEVPQYVEVESRAYVMNAQGKTIDTLLSPSANQLIPI